MSKPTKVLIAYDGSPFADAAIDELRFAGLGPGTSARVLTVTDPRISISEAFVANADFLRTGRVNVSGPGKRVQGDEALAAKGAARLRKVFPGWQVESRTVLAAPAAGILDEAGAFGADLIVVGSQGRTGLDRWLLGSVSEKVLAQARCAVRISKARRAGKEKAPRILLATDGSRAAKAMAKRVAERMWPENARFQVVTALDYPLNQKRPSARESAAALRVAEQTLAILARRGLQGTALVAEGDARLEIPKAARRFKATTLFAGRRGLNGVSRWLLGGISSHLARHAPCTIEVIAS